ncbi:MAG TPA: bifunctional phosphoribosylaminoimidazolecarboxamide formyltransferase/IMP cyclohydrolase, partial [Phycisphaerales bacterium]|nr:bifunctional phosphoribosylaminoimidazolecarboxamide formyltransferase/IMP cyclohydrolase [Phycisphaerales bacterium]
MPDLVPVRRALISVSDKTGVVDFARALASRGVEIISTGGTAKALTDAGIKVIPIEEVTKFPEMMDGRLKTLHPLIHGGILAVRDDAAHLKSMKEHGITPIDLVCVNLYPFEQTVAKPGVTLEEAIENIDIGGPTMIRAAAKNWEWVAAVTAPSQYRMVLDDLTGHNGCTSRVTRYALAHGVFELINGYDRAIAVHLISALTGNRDLQPAMYPITARMKELGDARLAAFAVRNPEFRDDGILPRFVSLQSKRHTELRYGENPHQQAAVYRDGLSNGPSLIAAEQLHGKELSYNNLNDAAAAMGIVEDFARLVPDHVGACVIKHTNPCGAAVAGSVAQAIDLAMIGDPLAAYGGILAVNQPIDLAGAKRLCREGVFLEVILAPSFAPDAVAALAQHSKMVRLLAIGESWPGKPGPAA